MIFVKKKKKRSNERKHIVLNNDACICWYSESFEKKKNIFNKGLK